MPELVSVIVPVWNGARFLAECLDSLAAQNHPTIEVIVVDDGSTDASATIAEGFTGVRVLRRPHVGLGATRNVGIEASTGSLIGFCDADDRWYPTKASVQVEYLDAHPDCDVVLCRQDTELSPGASAPTWLLPDQIRGDLDGVSPTSGLFRRNVLEEVGGFSLTTQMGVDFNLLVRTRAAGFKIELIEQPLRVRRIHEDNMTTRHGGAKAEMFQTIREHIHRKP